MTTDLDQQFNAIIQGIDTPKKWSLQNEINMRNAEAVQPKPTAAAKLAAVREQLQEDESKRYGINAVGELRLPHRGTGRSKQLGCIEYNDLKTNGDGITCTGTQCGRYIGELHEGDHYFCECGVNMLKYGDHDKIVLEMWQSHRKRTTPLDMTPKRLSFTPRAAELQQAYNKMQEVERSQTTQALETPTTPTTKKAVSTRATRHEIDYYHDDDDDDDYERPIRRHEIHEEYSRPMWQKIGLRILRFPRRTLGFVLINILMAIPLPCGAHGPGTCCTDGKSKAIPYLTTFGTFMFLTVGYSRGWDKPIVMGFVDLLRWVY